MQRSLSLLAGLVVLSLGSAALAQEPPSAASPDAQGGGWTDPPRDSAAPPAAPVTAPPPTPAPTPQGPPPASEVPGAPQPSPLPQEPTAQAPAAAGAAPQAGAAQPQEVMIWFRPEIGTPPELSLALVLHGGLGVHGEGQPLESFAVGGARLRSSISYFQFGGLAETSQLPGEYLVHVGGFVGAFVPLKGWIDLEGSLGFGVRRYLECSASNCSMDEEFTTPALSLRAGVSDRVGRRLGGRIGAELFASIDLDKHQADWVIPPTPSRPDGLRGTDYFGGVSVGLAVTAGLDWIPMGKVR